MKTTELEPYKLGTKVPPFGKIVAVKSGNPRDYLLEKSNTTTWLDELAIKALVESSGGDR